MNLLILILISGILTVSITFLVTFSFKKFFKKTIILLIPSLVSVITIIKWVTYSEIHKSEIGMGYLFVQLVLFSSILVLATNLTIVLLVKKLVNK